MRQTNETAKSFIQLKEITQIMQAQKTSAQNSTNTNLSEITSQSTLKPKQGALKPTKKAFSERQITTIRDNSQASTNKSLETKESNHANAFKSDEAKERREHNEA
ncbi:hypothetical protein AA971_05325 [Helicobacter pylori]|uniref:hypothetical protein n=1 Tax=Helicobacter pylori TaxID=210 RepID=UPI0007DB401A|nr:hypothetical protein [Helicobacter pylori]ANH42838.1 hypothetical protein AA971_05325 [Helicobacter pylori]